VIDVLATGFTLRRGAKFRDNLKRVKEALKESRLIKSSAYTAITNKSRNKALSYYTVGNVPV
jgi:hypothetical protein